MTFEKPSALTQDGDLDDVLQPGTSLSHGQYRIATYLRAGGFGITYLARNSFNRDVVVKECFVPAFCSRVQTVVRPRSEMCKAQMQKAIWTFLDEGQVLTQLSHPNIVRVRHVFQENDTAYMALEYIRGHDLLDMIEDNAKTLSPIQIASMASKLISALAHVHDRNWLHCDISPDNVCIRPDGEPVLIDFGSARKLVAGIGERQGGLSLVKDGYSPAEQYEANAVLTPRSDIYALGATLYQAITRKAPVASQLRLADVLDGKPDPMQPLANSLQGYPRGFLASIDKALALRSEDRHASAQDWQNALAAPVDNVARSATHMRRVVVTPMAASVPSPGVPLIPKHAEGPVRVQFRLPPVRSRVQNA